MFHSEASRLETQYTLLVSIVKVHPSIYLLYILYILVTLPYSKASTWSFLLLWANADMAITLVI